MSPLLSPVEQTGVRWFLYRDGKFINQARAANNAKAVEAIQRIITYFRTKYKRGLK